MVKLANTLVLGASASACGFDSHYPHHVGASFASLAPIFFAKIRARSNRCSSLPQKVGSDSLESRRTFALVCLNRES